MGTRGKISDMNLPPNQPCPHCGRYANRRPAVDAIIIRDNQLLLIRRGAEPFKGLWALPGGGIDYNQTVEDAVRNEVQEEVGLVVKSTKFLNIYSDPARDPHQSITLAYLVAVEGEPQAGSDAISYEFFSLEDIPTILAFDHRQIIDDYLKTRQQ
jgi:8-oxo-dGTP diphosphatase